MGVGPRREEVRRDPAGGRLGVRPRRTPPEDVRGHAPVRGGPREGLLGANGRRERGPAPLFGRGGRPASRATVRDLRTKVACSVCAAKMVAILRPYERDQAALLAKTHVTKSERAELKSLYTNT